MVHSAPPGPGVTEAGAKTTCVADASKPGARARAVDRTRDLVGEGDGDGDERAAAGRALEPELSVEDRKPVRETDDPGPVGPGAADAVVTHLDPEGAVRQVGRDRGPPSVGVLGDVGERLGHDEVGGRL